MTALLEEIKDSFLKVRLEHASEDSPVQIGTDPGNIPPGFMAMQMFYRGEITRLVRRGFRHFAGAAMPTVPNQLVEITRDTMSPVFLAMLLQTFADGVRVGHRDDQLIKMAFHYEAIDAIYENTSFVAGSSTMAIGFAEDDEIRTFFMDYLVNGIEHLTHITGFSHQAKVDPNQVWDLWVLIGLATIGSCYMAGHQMGSSWRERDVLDGIEIASGDDHDAE